MHQPLEFRVLGPLEILADGRSVKLDAPKQRAVLAMLLIHANEVVSTDQLLEAVWEEEQPTGGQRTLRYHISKLREALPVDVIRTRAPGYALEVSPTQVDSLVFESLLAEARDTRLTDLSGSLKLLDEALGLWRGSPYADFTYEEFAHSEIRSLQELQLRAMEERFEICLELGRSGEVVDDLQRLVDEHPRRERLVGALMLALYRSGRQADALSVYQDLRRELGEGLGIEPSQELRDLEERILLQDPALAEAAAAPAAEFLRGYVLRGRIGEGAHGVVWRAGQPGVGREVAIKAIHPDISNRPGFVRRFEMEAQLVASLEHPHIVSLFDFWRDPEGAYLVMPYLRGGDLDHLLRQGPLRPDTALELIQAIGGALAYAHRRGVIHCDVTPHNVLLDDEGHPYLADFGVATLIGETGPPISSSPAYLAPEQHAGRGAAPQTDVFSLGVLTHAVLTGQGAVEGQQLRPVSSYRADLAATVDEIIEVATSIDVTERYDTPDALVSDLGRALGATTPVVATPAIETRNPYKGLRAFAETDAGDFFGRESLESELVEALSRRRLIGVVGPSGCGKSSLVRAGLVPLLRRGVLPGSDRWLITDMYPGSQPFSELQAALLRVAIDLPERFDERLGGDAEDRRALLGELLPADAELLLIVDQFEELFTLTADEATRSRFLEALVEFAGDPLNRVRVVVTLRADFYDRPLEYPEFAELLRRGLVTIAVPGREDLVKAVTGPALRVGLEVEAGLAERITNDVAGQPGGLPLLEYALTELFQRRTESRLTLAGYEQTGGVLGALGRRAEDLYSGRDEAGQRAVQQVFLRLVTVEEGSADTRRRIPLTELRGMGLDSDALQQVLDDYGSHRLLTFDRDPDTRAPTVEVAHEALLTRWDRLRTWIDDRRDDLVLHRRLAASLNEWRDTGERTEYLLTGGRLEHYETFAAESDIALTREERDYMAQSRALADQLGARRRRRRRATMAGFGIAAMIATVFAVVAFLSQRRAEEAADEAQASEELAQQRKEEADRNADDARAQELIAANEATRARASELAAFAAQMLDEDADLSLRLLLESIDMAEPNLETIAALHETLLTHRVVMRVPEPYSWSSVLSPDGSMLIGFTDETYAAIEVPSGEVIWEKPQLLEEFVGGGVFTGDGEAVLGLPEVAFGDDENSAPEPREGLVRINAATGERTFYPIESDYELGGILTDGSGLVAEDLPIIVQGIAPGEVAVLRLDLASGTAETVATYDSGVISNGLWTTDAAVTKVALGAFQQTAVLDLRTRETRGYGPAASYRASHVMSPDGTLVVTTDRIRNDVWNIASDQSHWTIPAGLESALFSVDSEQLLVGNRLFSRDGETAIDLPVEGGAGSISDDGQLVLFDGEVVNIGPVGEAGTVDIPIGGYNYAGVDFEAGTGVALQSTEGIGHGTAYVYDFGPGEEPLVGETRRRIADVTGAVALSSDGRLAALQRFAPPSSVGQIGIYDTRSGDLLETLTGLCPAAVDSATGPTCRSYPETPFSGFAHHLLMSPDGSFLVAMLGIADEGRERAVVVWDLASKEITYFGARRESIGEPILSPAGERLLFFEAGGSETEDISRVMILDTATWEELGEITTDWDETRQIAGSIGTLRFSPSGSLLAWGPGLFLLEDHNWELIRRGEEPECFLRDPQFSPDGSTLASTCWDSGEILVFDADALTLKSQISTGDLEIRGIKFMGDSELLVFGKSGPGFILETDIDKLIELAKKRVIGEFTYEECEDFGIDPCPAEPADD